jgi:hypothetical protein
MLNTGAPFNLPYPEGGDDPDGPTQINALAAAVHAELSAVAAVISRSTPQSIAALASAAAVVFTTEDLDLGGLANLGANADRLTIVENGIYMIAAYGLGNTTNLSYSLEVGGSVLVQGMLGQAANSLATVASLVTGNNVRLLVANSAGSSQSITKARLAIARIAAT